MAKGKNAIKAVLTCMYKKPDASLVNRQINNHKSGF